MYKKVFAICVSVLILTLGSLRGFAQSEIPLECGQILESELVDEHPARFSLQIRAGTIIDVRVEPIGNSLNPHLMLLDTIGNVILTQNTTIEGQAEVLSEYVVSSSNPILEIEGEELGSTFATQYFRNNKSLGAYTISIGCTLADGTVIEPGGAEVSEETGSSSSSVEPSLAANDLAGFTTFPVTFDIPMPALFAPGGSERYAFSFVGAADQEIVLQGIRASGNMNVGISMVDPEGQIMFYGGLIVNDMLTVELRLPMDGEYRVAVWHPKNLGQEGDLQPTIAQFSVNLP